MNFQFDVNIYGNFEKISPVLSKARVRIFYSGLNRNFTYITEEFGEKLLKTLPYSPIVGKYENGDYSDHGHGNEQLQVYGVVPEEPNIKWETHLDKDGIERKYACADVLLWTARFTEANDIVNKSQSMELYPQSVKGQWKYKDGIKYFEFSEGCFLGLTALGDNVEPCFEGAAFYSYTESLKELINELKQYNLLNKGGSKMAFDFKLSDSEKRDAIFELINANLEYYRYAICDIYDDYALCYDYDNNKYVRFYYTKNDEDNSVTINNQETAYVLDVTEAEYQAITNLRQLVSSYTELEDNYTNSNNTINELTNQLAEATSKIEEYTAQTETLNTQNAEYSTKIEELNSSIEELSSKNAEYTAQINELISYKENVESSLKENLIDKYSTVIPEEILNNFKEKISEYTVEDFEKELALSAVENNNSLFSKRDNEFVPNGIDFNSNSTCSGAQRLVNRYTK